MTQLLRFERVTCRRGGRLLFEDLELELAAGEALHLAGANGSGKSSLIRLAAGLLRADSGSVSRTQAALADDASALDRELTLKAALRFWASLGGNADRLDHAIDEVVLTRLGQVPVLLLSAGQVKRETLARVAASGARLWLLDEPLNGLDTQGVNSLASLVERHRAEGGAVVAASHVPLSGEWRRLELGA